MNSSTQRSERPNRRLHRLSPEAYANSQYEFFFTVCARHQREPFRNSELAAKVVESLLWTRARYQWLLFCYCLMPDHLHFVCRLTADQVRVTNSGARGFQIEGVLDHLARFKSYTTNLSWKYEFAGPLWQREATTACSI
jgi:REP element-mobilizing transposase RayT